VNILLKLKIIKWVSLAMGALILLMDPTVKVALIVSIAPTITAVLTAWVNHRKLNTIEINTNSRLDKLLGERDRATTRADRAEGEIKGAEKKNPS
jgi:membrane protein implicated in regulation of membrane protease activity